MWPATAAARGLRGILGTQHGLIQAPMAGAGGVALAVAVCEAGGLGSLPCAMLDPPTADAQMREMRALTARPFNVNFFCHTAPDTRAAASAEQQQAWRHVLQPIYQREGVAVPPLTGAPGAGSRTPFDDDMCRVVERHRPAVVSFHFGLPDSALFERVKATGACVMSSATTVAEAVWLAQRGCDVVIAQGVEAGGHRGMFLSSDITTQVGTMALVPQVVDAVDVPVIAAGGIGDARGVAAAFALGASAVQLGTAYLHVAEATITSPHKQALKAATADSTALTNLFSGRPARGVVNRLMREVGPMNTDAPPFPTAGTALVPLKAAGEARGVGDYTSLWAGQGVGLRLPWQHDTAAALTSALVGDVMKTMYM